MERLVEPSSHPPKVEFHEPNTVSIDTHNRNTSLSFPNEANDDDGGVCVFKQRKRERTHDTRSWGFRSLEHT